ncbi:hypothetical protein GCM10012275_57500 [Longimycelium tulufanense]|uniref:Uncharacterized protein n=1 Tax=Longimycelium tulufanense TaxID=907463 RepID=A0A8J3CDR7_9PSEU|nr:hypothetical protein [Longimycelium tulufanense]GGM79413.1 hypothetical protein GCM10012275_57500 [Longimycelium tulufanense]
MTTVFQRFAQHAAGLLHQEPPDFSNIGPDSNGVPKSGIFNTIAEVLMYGGLGVLFIALLAGLILWGGSSIIKNANWAEDAKGKIAKAGIAAILVTAAGAFWTWILKL